MEVETLKSENAILQEKTKSNLEHIEILKGEKRRLEENLNSIYSQGKEQDLREEDIKRIPYLKRKLEIRNGCYQALCGRCKPYTVQESSD